MSITVKRSPRTVTKTVEVEEPVYVLEVPQSVATYIYAFFGVTNNVLYQAVNGAPAPGAPDEAYDAYCLIQDLLEADGVETDNVCEALRAALIEKYGNR